MVESEDENSARLVEATGCRKRLLMEEQAGQAEVEAEMRPSVCRPVRNIVVVCEWWCW